MSVGLNGRRLAEAAHPICRAEDPDQQGLPIAVLEAAVLKAGIEIGGKSPRQVLGTAVNNSQDLFEWVRGGRWRWIEPTKREGEGFSGVALAEEAYRLAMLHDPDRAGLHYEEIKRLLLRDGVIIRGANAGKTVFSSLSNADHWFEWIQSGKFRWKLSGGGA